MRKKMEQNLIVQELSAISGSSVFPTSTQHRIYRVLLYNMKKQLEKNKKIIWFSIALQDLKEFLPVDEQNKDNAYYKRQIKALEKLVIDYNILEKDQLMRVGNAYALDNVEFKYRKKDRKRVIIKYTVPAIVHESYLKMINGDPNVMYANINLNVMKKLKSKYAMKIYEICEDYKNVKGTPQIPIEKLYALLDIDRNGYYGEFKYLKRNIIDKAIEEINKTEEIPFTVSYDLTKKWKEYTHIKFIIKPKENANYGDDEEEDSTDEDLKVITSSPIGHAFKDSIEISKLMKLVPEKHRSDKLEKYIFKCIDEHGIDYVEAQIKYVNKQNPRSYAAYLRKAIEEDYANYGISSITEKLKENKKALEERKKKILEQEEEWWRKQIDKYLGSLSDEELSLIKEKAIENLQARKVLPVMLRDGSPVLESEIRSIIKEELKKKGLHFDFEESK